MPESVDDIAAWRKAERARLIAMRQAMAFDAWKAAGGAIMAKVPKLIPRAGIIGCYWPFRREPDCMPFMRGVLGAGGAVALPIVVGRGSPLLFRLWTEKTKMAAGPWSILEPAEGEPVVASALVVPLGGFDDAGYRLGYGAGYYDATLAARSPRPFTVGVGFEFSRLETIFPQPHDVPLDVIVTEDRVREFRET